MESAAKSLAFNGDKKSAKQLTQKADSVKKLLEDYSLEQKNIKKKKIRAIDFTNPSNDMIDNFKGIIDLKDIKIQKILNDIHEEYIRNDDLGISLSKQDQDNMMTMIIGNINNLYHQHQLLLLLLLLLLLILLLLLLLLLLLILILILR